MKIYDYWVAPYRQEVVTRYQLRMPKLASSDQITVSVVSDLHAGTPFMPMSRVERIVARTNALKADLILIPGDLVAPVGRFQTPLPLDDVARALGQLRAPLGVYATLGNHDWWDDRRTQWSKSGPPETVTALDNYAITTLQNTNRLLRDGLVLAGLDSQFAFWQPGDAHLGAHDLEATLEGIPKDAVTLLAAHEPDIFASLPEGVVDVAISGHTHGGQVRLFGTTPVVPSKYGARYVYGHIREGERDLVVSGGLGCSKAPLRLGVIPEIVHITLTGPRESDDMGDTRVNVTGVSEAVLSDSDGSKN